MTRFFSKEVRVWMVTLTLITCKNNRQSKFQMHSSQRRLEKCADIMYNFKSFPHFLEELKERKNSAFMGWKRYTKLDQQSQWRRRRRRKRCCGNIFRLQNDDTSRNLLSSYPYPFWTRLLLQSEIRSSPSRLELLLTRKTIMRCFKDNDLLRFWRMEDTY